MAYPVGVSTARAKGRSRALSAWRGLPVARRAEGPLGFGGRESQKAERGTEEIAGVRLSLSAWRCPLRRWCSCVPAQWPLGGARRGALPLAWGRLGFLCWPWSRRSGVCRSLLFTSGPSYDWYRRASFF